VALLREADEIKQQRPLFNKAGRHSRFNWGIYHFVDQRGYERFFIDRIKQSISQPLDAFSTREKAIQTLSSWVEEYNLCRQLAGLENNKGPCFSYQVNQCNGACIGNEKPADYNARVSKMLKKLSFSSSNFIVFDKGRHSGEKSFVWVEKNVLRGYGWLNQEDTITHPAQLEEYISGGTDNRDTRKIVRTWLNNKSTSQIRILKY
jgi:DNA polymerase-3 subunit epsilon